MERSTLSSALSQALSAESHSDVGVATHDPVPPASRLIRNFGPVDAIDYEVLLRLAPVANLRQQIALAVTGWEAAPADARQTIDASVRDHLTNCLGLYHSARAHLELKGTSGQQRALEYDTAMSGLDEVARLLDPMPGQAVKLDTPTVFARIDRRIDALIRALPRQSAFRDVDWRMPAIASHLPTFHLDFGAEHLELRCSVVG